MAEFRNKVLGVLDNIYGFLTAKKSVSQIQLNQPVQMVHDVSRQAETGSGYGQYGGYHWQNWLIAHAGAGSLRNAWDVYNNIAATTIDPNINLEEKDIGIWLIEIGNFADSANADYLYPMLMYDSTASILLAYWASFFDVSNFAASGSGWVSRESQAPARMWLNTPLFIPRGARFVTRSNAAGGAVNITFTTLLWVGPLGTKPPGLP